MIPSKLVDPVMKETLMPTNGGLLQVNAWGDQPTLEMVRLIVEWGGFCFLDKDKRGDFKVRHMSRCREALTLPRHLVHALN